MRGNKTLEYRIRNYTAEDASAIGEIDKLLELSCLYNPDFAPANIFCAESCDGRILGVGHIEPHDTWNLIAKEGMDPDFVYKWVINIQLDQRVSVPSGLKEAMMSSLLKRVREIKAEYPDKTMRVFKWLTPDQTQEIDFLLSHGFAAYANALVFKYDLSQEVPDVPKPEGITVVNYRISTEEELNKYYDALSIAFDGIVWSKNYLRWMKNGPEWADFAAFHGDELVGNTMTWLISEERSATEEIFVLPGYRKKGVARYVITYALKHLKSLGKSIATLSVAGNNKPAISLYRSLGYQMFQVMIEFGYDL